MAGYAIVPAHPPFPTAWNFPFHTALSGSHTSILISEGPGGVSVACTRQNAGSAAYGFGWLPRPPRAPPRPAPRPAAPSRAGAAGGAGGVNTPAATACAEVIRAFCSGSTLRLSQVAAEASGE